MLVTGLSRNEIVNDHKNTVYYQTKMLVIQALFDLYKVISIELHRRVDYKNRSNKSADFFERCPSCINGYLMKNEYQTMIDSIREPLLLINGMNGHFAKLRRDPIRHEAISDTGNLSFIENCSSSVNNEEMTFQRMSELARYGLNLDMVPNQFRKYNNNDDDHIRCRSVNNVLNRTHRNASWYLPFLLSDIDPCNECVSEVHVALKVNCNVFTS